MTEFLPGTNPSDLPQDRNNAYEVPFGPDLSSVTDDDTFHTTTHEADTAQIIEYIPTSTSVAEMLQSLVAQAKPNDFLAGLLADTETAIAKSNMELRPASLVALGNLDALGREEGEHTAYLSDLAKAFITVLPRAVNDQQARLDRLAVSKIHVPAADFAAQEQQAVAKRRHTEVQQTEYALRLVERDEIADHDVARDIRVERKEATKTRADLERQHADVFETIEIYEARKNELVTGLKRNRLPADPVTTEERAHYILKTGEGYTFGAVGGYEADEYPPFSKQESGRIIALLDLIYIKAHQDHADTIGSQIEATRLHIEKLTNELAVIEAQEQNRAVERDRLRNQIRQEVLDAEQADSVAAAQHGTYEEVLAMHETVKGPPAIPIEERLIAELRHIERRRAGIESPNESPAPISAQSNRANRLENGGVTGRAAKVLTALSFRIPSPRATTNGNGE